MRANNQQYTKKNKLIVGYNNYSLITAWLIYYQSQIFPSNHVLEMNFMLNLPVPGHIWMCSSGISASLEHSSLFFVSLNEQI